MLHFPFLTAYDPPVYSEGTLDLLGVYMIADQLATRLVPAVRERMQRVRFLTPITVGTLVTEDLEPNDRHPNILPPRQVLSNHSGILLGYAAPWRVRRRQLKHD